MRHSVLFGAILLAFSTHSLAADSLINTNSQFSENTTVTISSASNEATNRLVGIESNSGDMTVEIADGVTLTVTNQDNQSLDRYYGAVTKTDATLNVKGDTVFNLSADTEQIHVIRGMGGAMTFDGAVTIDARGQQGNVIGVNFWDAGSADFLGNTVINVNTESGQAMGATISASSKLNFSGSRTEITSKSTGGRVFGVQNWASSGGIINFNSADTVITAINAKDSTNFTQGLLAYQSTTNFLGNVTLTVEGGQQATYGVDVQCDPGNQYDTIVNFSGAKTDINASGSGAVYGLSSSGVPGSINLTSDEISISATSTEGAAVGIWTQYGALAKVDNPEATVEITASAPVEAIGIINTTYGNSNNKTIQFGTVDINATTVIDVTSQGSAIGIANIVFAGDSVDVFEDTDGISLKGSTSLNVTADGETAQAIGVLADNSQNGEVKPEAKTTIENLVATVEGKNGAAAVGIVGQSQADIILSGQSVVEAIGENAVGADLADSVLSTSGSVTVTGTQEGIVMDDTAVLNAAEAAQITTNSIQSSGTTNLQTESMLTVTGGNDVTSSLGTVNATQATVALGAGSYDAESLNGDNNVLLLTDLANTSEVAIGSKTGALSLQATSLSNDQYANVQEAAQALAQKVKIADDQNADQNSLAVAQGQINDALTGTLNEDGTLSNVVIQKNTTLDAFGSVAAISALTMRHELNSLSKRMGELRDAPEGVGLWARVYGSELEYGHQNLESQNVTFQMGSDITLGDWKVGAAFNYTNGDIDYTNGSADSDNYGFALYGTWFVPCGAYVDLIARYARLDNDFKLNAMSGSYDNDAFSLSAETGYHWEVAKGFFIEPQIGLSYSRIEGANFTADNGVRVKQDNYDSFMARAGVRTGFNLPNDKGTVYVRFSGVYDFEGELEGSARLGNSYNTIYEDLGGKWFETGIGANINWTKNTYSYFDFERTSGGEVKENYRWNIGIRHTF